MTVNILGIPYTVKRVPYVCRDAYLAGDINYETHEIDILDSLKDDLSDLDKIDWEAVRATQWSGRQDKKQAEFLVERCFSWELFDEIGVYSYHQQQMVHEILGENRSFPLVKIKRGWYY